MHVHLIAVAGTGMGSLAGLLKAAGHDVSGSDGAFYPPMGPALERWGIRLFEGYDASHLSPRPDLVVVGNACRRDNTEVVAAQDAGLKLTSMVAALADHVLTGTSPLVVGGTHGKTTTSSLCAWILSSAGMQPGFLIGGLPKNFSTSFALPAVSRGRALPLIGEGATGTPERRRRSPFVVEGDEYDTAFFEKTPKFWHYKPEVAVITSVEHDHVDIYPNEASYLAAFAGFVSRVPEHGLIVAHAADAKVVDIVNEHARAEVAWYALDGEELHGCAPHWLGSSAGTDASGQAIDLFLGGMAAGRLALPMCGRHNALNTLAALAACCHGFGVSTQDAKAALATFAGIARRQDLIGEVDGVRVYDDFAHHPTAVRETLRGLKRRHPEGRLWAIYEPRTNTACRSLHQAAYLDAFDAADRVVFPPLGRDNIPKNERLNLAALVRDLGKRNVKAQRAENIDAIVTLLRDETEQGDTIALLSNGAFGGIYTKLLGALRGR